MGTGPTASEVEEVSYIGYLEHRIELLEFALASANKVIEGYEARYGGLGEALNPDAEEA